ncbi:P-loop containing nucleoside triphosphate hydrolase protein [Suillus clintonianus]|uniref:P-loop containing nucleoside triphosphate hydrolase protein n=1 Tax=Suillus clintonianus TaxID=1904413 RepID=UPI001B87B8CA|nr:P-loop containing nucleoside triphosphate hydrolase protein [Suillus clintonianus]KAG2153898.1 P-loop containing nucleoside triphosphate hydrolase protein [Suillus clintonianus]
MSPSAVSTTDTNCNVVIFGQTGHGKSSLVNLIAKTQMAQTSRDSLGCTAEPRKYVVLIESETLKVKLHDTPGLGEGSEGVVPDKEAREALKKLLRSLRDDVHLLVYCVRGVRATRALYPNYDFIRSVVKETVPIVIVATGLEDKEPEMEQWWTDNEQSVSDLGMTFAGHACVTALTVDRYSGDRFIQRHHQSYSAVCRLIEQCRLPGEIQPQRQKTIVIFGETGAGKSSLVNLMAEKDVAYTSADMQRCTLRWQEHVISFSGDSYTVFDTVGLEEPQLGIKEYLETVENAYQLIKHLDKQGGIDLLLFCVRAGRVTATLQSNYRLFHEFLCEKKVPIVLAITNLEREERMEDWWVRNGSTFKRYQIEVAGHACITAANRSDGRHKDLYEQSRTTMRKIVQEFTADGQKNAWIGGDNLFVSLTRKLKGLVSGEGPAVKRKDLVDYFTKRLGLSREVAKQLADMIKQDDRAAT